MTDFILLSGMPRAGSELLINFLAQNPDVFPGKPSGLLPMMINARNLWDELTEHKAIPVEVSDARKIQVLRAMVDSYWQVEQPYIIDGNRGWIAHLELIENVLQRKVKVLVPVRDLREILASCEMLWRRNAAIVQIPQEMGNYKDMQHYVKRCEIWMKDDQFVGMAYNRIADVIQRGYLDRLFFVHYERLTSDPIGTVASIYNFLDIPYYGEHDPKNVVKVTIEDDRVHGFRGLHDIRPEIGQVSPKRHVIAEAANTYIGPYVWDTESIARHQKMEHNLARVDGRRS